MWVGPKISTHFQTFARSAYKSDLPMPALHVHFCGAHELKMCHCRFRWQLGHFTYHSLLALNPRLFGATNFISLLLRFRLSTDCRRKAAQQSTNKYSPRLISVLRLAHTKKTLVRLSEGSFRQLATWTQPLVLPSAR